MARFTIQTMTLRFTLWRITPRLVQRNEGILSITPEVFEIQNVPQEDIQRLLMNAQQTLVNMTDVLTFKIDVVPHTLKDSEEGVA